MNVNDTVANAVDYLLKNDGWIFIVALFLTPNGVWGLIVGRTIFWSGLAPAPGDYQAQRLDRLYPRVPLYMYQGRGLALIETIVGAILGGLFLLARQNPPLIVTRVEAILSLFTLAVGVVVFLFLSFTNGSSNPNQTPATSTPLDGDKLASQPPKVKTKDLLPLAAAAQMLNLPETELQQMAENGGIAAHRVNGNYLFDRPTLDSFNEAMQVLRQS
jgi:hypothetical protein